MRDPDKIWEEKFNDHSLDDESWLDPAMDVFQNISAEIYGLKKKRKWFFILLFMILGFIISVSLMILPPKQTQVELNKKGVSKTEMQHFSILSGNKKDIPALLETGPEIKITESIVINPAKNADLNVENKSIFVSDKLPLQTIKNSLGFDSELNEKIGLKKFDNLNEEKSLVHKASITLNDVSLQNNSSDLNVFSPSELSLLDENVKNIEIASLSKTPATKINGVVFTSMREFKAPLITQVIEPEIKKGTAVYMAFGVNYDYWNFALNNNYTTALNPADFSHSSGIGASLNLTLGKQLLTKLDLVGSISIQKIKFSSGHNSSINYELNQEVEGDNSNTFHLTMASPIGFVESDLIVQRNSAESTLNTDLVVDLHNEHNITNLDVNIGLDYSLIENGHFRFVLGFRTGINKFLNINNTLSSFGLNDSNFSSGAKDIVKEQSNVKSLTGYLGSSLKIEYNLGDNLTVGTNISISTNLAPIYQENDFSTQLNRIQSGVYLRKLF